MLRQSPAAASYLAAVTRTATVAVSLLVLTAAMTAQEEGGGRGDGRTERRGRAPVSVITAAVVHPVAGPAIEHGVVVLRGDRIVAVGSADEIEIPEGASRTDYPNGHVYPGLVDALSVGYGDAAVLEDGSSDAGTAVLGGLDPLDRHSAELVKYGITTAYVSNRGATTWRGLGAIVHPGLNGFEVAEGEASGAAAVQMRVFGGEDATHPLDRLAALQGLDKPFKELEGYREKREEYAKKLEEYGKEFEEYLEHFRKKGETKDEGGGESEQQEKTEEVGKAEAEGKTEEPAKEKDEGAKDEGAKPAGEEKGEEKKEEGNGTDKDKGTGTKKPDYPKPPDDDPAKDALLRVVDGDLPLRIEAGRPEEIAAALQLAQANEIPKIVLELFDEGSDMAEAIHDAGVPVVANGSALIGAGRDPDAPRTHLAARLRAAGVAVAIGSGSLGGARFLPLLAAAAAGAGMDDDDAIAAITLIPAQVLGVSRQVGSLEPGKRADLLVTSAPLLQSDARILAVYSGGAARFEAK